MRKIVGLIFFLCNILLLKAQKFEIKEDTSKLYVFVGEKIEVVTSPPNRDNGIWIDESFKAKYKVIQNIHGDYKGDTIEFKAFDHYGVPPFSKYKIVLLFVSEHQGKLYHEKYQYFDVYKTKNGKWASHGDPYKFDDYHRKKLKAVKIEFEDTITIDVSNIDTKLITTYYPQPFYKIENGKAIPLMGTYVDELFIVKKEGVLKARGFFYKEK